MKRFLLVLLAVASAFSFLLPHVATAQALDIAPETGISRPAIYPAPNQNPSFLGQSHSYSVVFRGNGEAVVTLKAALYNDTDAPLREIQLRVPDINPQNASAYQIILERQCIRYDQSVYDPVTRRYPQGPCLQYQEPDHFGYYGQAKYAKAEYRFEGDTIYVVLPQEIAASSTGSFFVHFRAMGYTQPSAFGAFRYEFETLKINDEISNLQMGISTDSDLYLRGARGEVNYRYAEPELAKLDSMAAGAPVGSAQLDQFVQQIGYGTITKTASNLSALESYTTEGLYGSSRIGLYAREIVIFVIVLVVIVVILVIVARFVWRLMRKRDRETGEEKKSAGPLGAGPMFLVSGVVGFVAAFLAVGYSVFLMFLMENLSSMLNYRYEGIFAIIILLISLGMYLLLLVLPSVIVGLKRGAMWGVATFVATIIWLILMLIVLFVGVSLIINSSEIYPFFSGRVAPGVPVVAE